MCNSVKRVDEIYCIYLNVEIIKRQRMEKDGIIDVKNLLVMIQVMSSF